ncbi:MAG: hypothetical protein NTV70_01335 [Acidobacteria bacterium]|nr:hypothetical protein [Acidobacteriota bacterium]
MGLIGTGVRAALTIGVVLLSGCAYIGEPLPPALKIPQAIADLRAVQRGSNIVVDFTPPALTTDGLTIATPGPLEILINDTTPTEKVIPVGPWVGQRIALRARTKGTSGRLSDWSNTVTLIVVAPVATPTGFEAKPVPTGVELSWTGSATTYRIFRDQLLLATARRAPYIDTTTEYEKKYEYEIVGISGAAESERPAAVTVTPVDVFPPEVPTGLTALSGVASIELSWDRSAALDWAEYRVFRDGQLLANSVSGPSYSDKTVVSGRAYKYAVSAVDRKGNASPVSSIIEVTLP